MASIDLNNCNQVCFGCIKKYKAKHKLEKGQSFDVPCKGIPKDYIPIDLLGSLKTEEKESATAMLDPVAWAAATLDWHCFDEDGEIWKRKNPEEYYEWKANNPGKSIKGHSRYHRPYQGELLRCTSKRKVARIGRQAGKCLETGTLVMTPTGPVAIETLKVGDTVIGWNKDNTISSCKVLQLHNQGLQQVVDLTHFGIPLATCTEEHRWLTKTSDIEVRRVNEFASNTMIVRKWYKSSLGSIYESHAYVLGALAGDGCSREKGKAIYISSEDHLIPTKVASLLSADYKKCSSNNYTWVINSENLFCNNYDKWFKNKYAHEKTLDLELIKTWDRVSCLQLLAGLIDTDGSVNVYNGILNIRIGMQSKNIIEVIQYLLIALFQYQANISEDSRTKYKNGSVWIIKCANNLFSKQILKELDPYLVVERKKWKNEYSLLKENNSNSDFVGVKIGEQTRLTQCWDISVDNETNLYCLANGLVTHNTDAIVVNALFHMFTKPGVPEKEGFKIILITPYQAQIEVVFNRIMQLLQNSPVTQNSLMRNVKAPIYTIELKNGSTIRGFTAGTKSGGNAGSVRGQTGNMLLFDEADYLAPGDIDSALSIVTNHPNATVWMSSTPSGKREKFYQICNSKAWKEFHYASSVNPMYSAEQDHMFRESLTEIGYKHEVLAEFGEQEEGVFQNSYVQAARMDFKYGQYAYNHTWRYTVGVDWNDTKNGTTIAVLGFNPLRNKFILVDRYIVSREGWTQLSACQKIAEVNRLWHPISIYLDAGYGGTQYEVLRKFGYDALTEPTKGPTHPDAKLPHVLKQYDFGSKVQTRDIFTGQPTEKEAKPFLVESTIRRFEAQDIEIPLHDTDLEEQLLGYVIDRVTPTGRPVYKASSDVTGDHLLDAMMLSIISFILEVTPLGKARYETNISFSGQFGEKTDGIIHEGDTVIKPDLAHKRAQEKEKRQPASSRALPNDPNQVSLMQSKDGLPGNHINREAQVKSWSWNGFLRDEPRPQTRSGSQAEGDARQRLGLPSRQLGKPKRKNI